MIRQTNGSREASSLSSEMVDTGAAAVAQSVITSAPTTDPAPSRRPARSTFCSIKMYLQAEIPIFIPCFNNPTYTARMITQLRELGFRRIVLVDGGSAYPAMVDLLENPGNAVSIVSLPANPGPHVLFEPSTFALLPRHFCITDPDLCFNPAMPADFLGDLATLTVRERVGKAGLALDISDRSAMRAEPFIVREQAWQIWDFEEQFWRNELPPLEPHGDPVYRASVDTTFALYDKAFFHPDRYDEAVRVAGRFTCRHLPWYRDKELPAEEERFYGATERFSYYLKAAGTPGPNGHTEP